MNHTLVREPVVRALLLFVLLAGCTANHPAKNSPAVKKAAIIGGEAVLEDESNLSYSAAAIVMKKGLCSGILIAPRVVLTARHCVKPEENLPAHIYLGTSASVKFDDNRNPERKYEVKTIIPYAGFNDKNPFEKTTVDLAILILKEEAKAPFKPMKIEDNFDLKAEDTSIIVAGFSVFSAPAALDVFQLLAGVALSTEYDKTNVNNETDMIQLLSRGVIQSGSVYNKDSFIAYQLSGGACSGDSGGPSMVRKNGELFLVGINRAVTGMHKDEVKEDGKEEGIKKYQAFCEYLFYSTSVSYHKEWILKAVKDAGEELPEFITNTSGVDEQEQKCATQVSKTIEIYQTLFKPDKGLCEKLEGVNVENHLINLDAKCKAACGDIKEYKDQCDFYSRGALDMADYFAMTCKEL